MRGCWRCGRKSGLQIRRVIGRASFVHPLGLAERSRHARCLDEEDCRVYRDRRREAQAVRSKLIVIQEPALERAEAGRCRWCGESIEVVEDAHPMSRRRTLHRGDAVELGDRNCVHEYNRSRCWTARDALAETARLAGAELRCADCDALCLNADVMSGEGCVAWEADHEVALWKGGEHELANFRARCVPCHDAKTRREAAERAAIRRGDLDVDQLSLQS